MPDDGAHAGPPAAAAAISATQRALHLVALSALALTQPLLDLLGRHGMFFVAHRAEAGDVLLLVLLVAVLPPALLFGLECLIAAVAPRALRATHLVLVGALVAALLAPDLDRRLELPGIAVLACAAAAGLLAAAAYRAWAPLRSMLSLLAAAPLVLAAVFLTNPDVAQILAAPAPGGAAVEGGPSDGGTSEPGDTPDVVLVVFDELPITTLMADADEIDARLFPNFAALAATSTWYRNATTVHEFTDFAVPAIFTGQRPDPERDLPVAAQHPRSLFTLLAGTHRMAVRETLTSVCPAVLLDAGARPPFGRRFGALARDAAIVLAHVVVPEDLTGSLPDVTTQWGDFGGTGRAPDGRAAPGVSGVPAGNRDTNPRVTAPAETRGDGTSRVAAFRRFVALVDDDPRPTLRVHHVMLPHTRWVYLPSGTRYVDPGRLAGLHQKQWRDEWSRTVAMQRHLLQTGMVDRLLGELLQRLRDAGRFDNALIVVTADHGVSFEVGTPQREAVDGNHTEIMRVPLFVKLPGQQTPHIDDRNVESIDILPTLADALDVPFAWAIDGVSLLSDEDAPRSHKTLVRRRGEPLVVSGAAPRSWPGLETRRALLGSPSSWADVLAVGDEHDLIGTPLPAERISYHPSLQVHVEGGQRLARVGGAQARPLLLEGYVTGGQPPRQLVFATDGVFRAVTRPYGAMAGRSEFVALLPEDALRDGRNDLAVFALDDHGNLTRLPDRTYALAGNTLVAPDGRRVTIEPTPAGGMLDTAIRRDGLLQLAGWAGDGQALRRADAVIVFDRGRYAWSGPTGLWTTSGRAATESPDAASPWRAGFQLAIPPDALSGPPEGRLRIIALHADRATELPLSAAATWIGAP